MVDSAQRSDKRGAFDICADMLYILEREPGCNRTALGVKSNLDSRAMSKYVDILEKFELIMTTGTHRQTRIMISEKGKRYLHQYTRLVALLDEPGSRSALV
jgi:predicted transcriptional regulator